MKCLMTLKKTRPGGVRPPPWYYEIEEDMQGEKTSEPLSHSYTRATYSHVNVGPALSTINVVGPGLNMCFVGWRDKEIFLT
jgi:hypothetical protein